MRTLLLILMFITTSWSGEALPKPDVPDPFGLGERLALIDHLREQMGVQPPPDATMDQLVALYWKHTKKSEDQLTPEQAQVKDRIRRLRAELKRDFDIDAPADAEEATLGKLLADARGARQDAAVQVVLDKAAAREQPRTAEEAARYAEQDRQSAQARVESIDADVRADQRDLTRIDKQREELMQRGVNAIKSVQEARNMYEQILSVYNKNISEYNRLVQEGGDTTALGEKIKPMRVHLEQIKQGMDAQLAEIEAMKQEDLALMAEKQRITERMTRAMERRDEAQRDVGAAGATPGGRADKPLPNTLEARLVNGVMLLVVPDLGAGTGFCINSKGLIVTNAHVVGSPKAKVHALWDASSGRKAVTLRVIEYAEADDLALLQAESGAPFEVLPMREQYTLSTPIFAAGFPLAGNIAQALQTSPSDIVLSRGILGAVRRNGDRVEWLQHDCRLASGNSGGPIIDMQSGAVIGVNTMVLSSRDFGAAGDGINLAIPIRKVMDRFAKHLKP